MSAMPPEYKLPEREKTFVRRPRPGDQNYIASTWLGQLRDADREYARGVRWGLAGRHVDAVLDRADTRALVRHAPGDVDGIYGWVVYAEGPGVPLIHFVYVRRDHRKHGYATELLIGAGVKRDSQLVYTTRGPSTPLMTSHYPRAVYVPLADFLG